MWQHELSAIISICYVHRPGRGYLGETGVSCTNSVHFSHRPGSNHQENGKKLVWCVTTQRGACKGIVSTRATTKKHKPFSSGA